MSSDQIEQIQKQQPDLVVLFKNIVKTKRLGHAYLFEGGRGTGKRMLALFIAQELFREPSSDQNSNTYDRILSGDFPDVSEIFPEGRSIKVDQVRSLKQELSKSGVERNQKIYIIHDAEKMTNGAANSLLHFLEEPQNGIHLFLLTTAKENILPTIRSRCQTVHFKTLNKKVLQENLINSGVSTDISGLLAQITNNLEEALTFSKDETFLAINKRAWRWFQLLNEKDIQAFIEVQTEWMQILKEKIDAYLCLDLLVFYYRDLLYVKYHNEEAIICNNNRPVYQSYSERAEAASVIKQIEVILEGKNKLDANVQMQGVLEYIALACLN